MGGSGKLELSGKVEAGFEMSSKPLAEMPAKALSGFPCFSLGQGRGKRCWRSGAAVPWLLGALLWAGCFSGGGMLWAGEGGAAAPLQAVTKSGKIGGPFRYRARLERAQAGRQGASAVLVTLAIPPNHHVVVDLKIGQPKLAPVKPTPPGLVFGNMEAPEPLREDLDLTPQQSDPAKKQFQKGLALYKKKVTLRLPFTVAKTAAAGPRTLNVELHVSGCQERPRYQCFIPGKKRFSLAFTVLDKEERASRVPAPAPPRGVPPPATGGQAAGPSAFPAGGASGSGVPDGSASGKLQAIFSSRSLWFILGALFLAGLAANLLPCVYPLIPITLSVIGAKEASSKGQAAALAGVFGLGIVAVYVGLGLLAGMGGGQFGQIINRPWVLLSIAGVCTLMAFSMFGAFELALPGSWQTKLSKAGGQGKSFGGAFAMGVVSGLLASACVGPVLVGILVLIARTGSALKGGLYLLAFALGFALPYVVLGATAASVPKPGAWMVTVKHMGGLILLGVALYYVGKLYPGAALLLTAVTAVTAGVFSGAFDALRPESGTWPRVKKSFGVLAVAVGLLLLLGVAEKLGLTGLPQGAAGSAPAAAQISWQRDPPAALAAARKKGQPALLDFRSDSCTVCLQMEHSTYLDPRVVAQSRGIAMVEVDTTGNRWPEITRKFQVLGLPTLVFLDAQGKERKDLRHQGGYLNAAELLDKLNRLSPANP